MHHGVVLFQDDFAMRPDDAARAAEDRGFESIFFVDHTHIPVRRTTPYPLGGELPKDYYHNHDILVAMSYAAAVTKNIKIGSGVSRDRARSDHPRQGGCEPRLPLERPRDLR